MASLGELYPKCVQSWIDPEDGELIPSVEYECVWRFIVREGEKVITSKAQLRELGEVRNWCQQDSGHVLVRIKGKGWFAIAENKPGVVALARSLV